MTEVDFRDIFEKAEVGIALNDPETGTIGRVNQHYADLFGYGREELRSMEIEEISAEHPTFDQEEAMQKVERALAGDPQRFEWLFLDRDGDTFWGEVSLKRATIGTTDRLLAFVRDISDRKQFERRLKEENQRLETFASMVSHDLRNPLNVALGHVDMLMEQIQNEHVDAIERSMEQMEELIEEMLSLAKAGEGIGSTTRISLEKTLEDCWDRLDPGSAALRVETDRIVEADRTRFRQLLDNLLRNAIKHAGEDVTVAVGEIPDGFYVEDDGPGFPIEDPSTLLEAGYSTEPDGTGYGLHIVKDIAHAHEWQIHLTERSAGGARIEFRDV
jgi:PAS domain S-box-containing protein